MRAVRVSHCRVFVRPPFLRRWCKARGCQLKDCARCCCNWAETFFFQSSRTVLSPPKPTTPPLKSLSPFTDGIFDPGTVSIEPAHLALHDVLVLHKLVRPNGSAARGMAIGSTHLHIIKIAINILIRAHLRSKQQWDAGRSGADDDKLHGAQECTFPLLFFSTLHISRSRCRSRSRRCPSRRVAVQVAFERHFLKLFFSLDRCKG
jgi:hypothetical protein